MSELIFLTQNISITVTQLEIAFRLLLAAGLGILLGFEREYTNKPAGMRTHALVTLGAALFTVLSQSFFEDPARIAAGIVTGIGFLGAGTIFKSKKHVEGLTTAANLWVAAAIGLAIGVGFYFYGIVGTIIALLILQVKRLEKKFPSE